MDAFALPMDADPSRDPVVAYDEFGRPVRAGRLGTRYIQGAAPVQRNSLAGTPLSLADVMATSGGARGAGQPRQTSQFAPANAPEPSWGPLGGLANMLLEGFQAPGNALAGRPVTLGEVYGTAGTAALGGTAVPRPANALGANSFRAYHGSPHDFDKFSMDKIGTGEGAQAYGHGLYFAENEGIARSYRDALAKGDANDPVFNVYDLVKNGLPPQEARKIFQEIVDDGATHWPEPKRAERLDFARRTIEAIDSGALDKYKPPGSMYEVQINADPEAFVDIEKPLKDQPGLEPALRKYWGRHYDSFMSDSSTSDGDYFRQLSQDPANKNLYVQEMRDAGIPGLKYLDAGSRYTPSNLPDNPISNEARAFLDKANGDAKAAMDAFNNSNPVDRWAVDERDEVRKVIKAAGSKATSNYVVFDDKLIDIVRKYGWAAAAPMLAQMGMTPEQAQAQYEAQN